MFRSFPFIAFMLSLTGLVPGTARSCLAQVVKPAPGTVGALINQPVKPPRPFPGVGLRLKTPTFVTTGRQLIDPCGSAIVLKGVNKQCVFDFNDPNGEKYFAQIALTGANCVRIVWEMNASNPATAGQMNPLARLDAFITNAKAARLIPIVGLWDFTGDEDGGFSHLKEYVDYWTRDDVIALIKKHESALIINIANEAGTGNENVAADLDAYTFAYVEALGRLRRAKIRVPVMIDGMDRGKSLHCFADRGPKLVAADPFHRVIFSFHAYWPKTDTDAAPTLIRDALAEVAPLQIPIVMGELTAVGAWPGSPDISICAEAGKVDYQQFAQLANAQNMGWLTWEWGPGNQWHVSGDCPQMDMTTDGTFASLQNQPPNAVNAWAKELAITAPISIKNTAKRTFFVDNRFGRCP